jgi:hypothetical protein
MKVVQRERSEPVMRAAQPYTIAAFVPVCSGIFAGHLGPSRQSAEGLARRRLRCLSQSWFGSRLRHETPNRRAHDEPLAQPIERPSIRDAERSPVWASAAHRVSRHTADVVCWREFASRGAADRAQRLADLLEKIKIAGATTTQKQQSANGLTTQRNNCTNASLKL